MKKKFSIRCFQMDLAPKLSIFFVCVCACVCADLMAILPFIAVIPILPW